MLVSHIEEAVDGLFSSYNLADRKVQQFYSAVTGDVVQRQPWWRELTGRLEIKKLSGNAACLSRRPPSQVVDAECPLRH